MGKMLEWYELLENWELARKSKTFKKVSPLK
jgi:hypothetical protein